MSAVVRVVTAWKKSIKEFKQPCCDANLAAMVRMTAEDAEEVGETTKIEALPDQEMEARIYVGKGTEVRLEQRT